MTLKGSRILLRTLRTTTGISAGGTNILPDQYFAIGNAILFHSSRDVARRVFVLNNAEKIRPFGDPKHVSAQIRGLQISTSVDSEGRETEAEAGNAEEQAGPLVEYERKITSGYLLPGDRNQEDALRVLQSLYDKLQSVATNGRLNTEIILESSQERTGGWLWSQIFSRGQSESQTPPIRGLYLYGGVGTGKTMLMDMFYEELPDTWSKTRKHFHDFMLNVHSRLQRYKGMADPLAVVADELSKVAAILCLDEFMVTDVADALILNRLFGYLWKRGIVLVCTSNRAPDQLYEGGLQRDLFLPFIDMLKRSCIVHEIGSITDYRKLTAAQKGYYFVGDEAAELLREKFHLLTAGNQVKAEIVEVVMGRKLQVPEAAGGCCFFPFHELCEMPLGAADYFGLFNKYHTLFLKGVPVFGSHNRTAAYRFVTLVDVMYEHRAMFVCSAEADPFELFRRIVTISEAPKRTSARASRSDDADICVDNELGFSKERTISRLTEMQSREYIECHATVYLDNANNKTRERS